MIIHSWCTVSLLLLLQQDSLAQFFPQTGRQQQRTCQRTRSQTEGPYFVQGAPKREALVCTANPVGSSQITITGRILDADCSTGLAADLDAWQADQTGTYSMARGDYNCRAKIATDAQGNYQFTTIFPGYYGDGGDYRPRHIHFKVIPRTAGYRTLTTQLYFANDPFVRQEGCDRYTCAGDPTLTINLTNATFSRVATGTWNVYMQRS